MPDYIRNIQNGQMMIRDTGGWVEFWFKTGSSTWNNEQDWSYYANGQHVPGVFRLVTGGNWQKFGAVFVSGRQDVRFTIVGEGLGWPTTDYWVFIERARIPDAPRAPYFFERNSSQIHVAFDYNYDGGSPIREAEIWHSYDHTARYLVRNTRDTWISGLSPKTRYFFWGKVRNDFGWSSLGARSETTTVGTPDRPGAPNVSAISATQVRGGFSTYPWDGGSPIREWQIGYGLNPNTPEVLKSGDRADIDGLQAAKLYYFWARGRNDYGWGPWSPRKDVPLTAGAWVNQAGVWKRALPWVKINGVWTIAKPNLLVNGTWKVPRS